MQTGVYKVRQSDLPLWRLSVCKEKTLVFCVSAMSAGETTGGS
jgi:hypothetical protein